jgi:hypothetical protein
MKEEYIEKFNEKYYRFQAITQTDLWEKILDIVGNQELLGHFIFANDILKIPPVKTFLMYSRLEGEEFTNPIKQSIGAAFGCLFQDFLGYSEKSSVSCVVANVKRAALFSKEV